MKEVNTFLSTYTADVSAVCSALYELGGMIVIHDPSGCNSTYNTHDEPRWYEQDSLIFISGLSEIDAIMGNDEKFIRDVITAARVYQPEFVVLLQSPVPLLMGTDFLAIAEQIESEIHLPVYFIPTTGMNSYIWGAGEAFWLLADKFVETPKPGPQKETLYQEMPCKETSENQEGIRVNLLGLTPLDFSVNQTVNSLKEEVEKQGFLVQSSWAMGSDLCEIKKAGAADVNIVVASSGLKAAQTLEKRFGIPYVVGLPVGDFALAVWESVRNSAKTGKSCYPYKNISREADCGFVFIGEPVIGQSIACALAAARKKIPVVITMQEIPGEIAGKDCREILSEEELKTALLGARTVVADPLFLPVCPKDAVFYSFPQESCSGRIYRKEIPDYIHMF